MMGAFHCPYCGTANACDCNTCSKYIKEGEYVNTYTEDGEAMICGKCAKIYSPDQSLEFYKIKLEELAIVPATVAGST